MSNSYFQFKRFIVRQDKCAMKVGTDGVLLGALADVENTDRILDVGTGTGLIALMLAQRTQENVKAKITALEIDEDAAGQAAENIADSPWKEKMEVVRGDFRTFATEERFDLIVSNPPYFIDSLKCPDKKRSNTRHTDSLSFEELIGHGAELLRPEGRLDLIFPTQIWGKVRRIAGDCGLVPSKTVEVYTTPESPSKRMLASFSKLTGNDSNNLTNNMAGHSPERLYIETSDHTYTEEFYNLTKAFYLNKQHK